ncbi:Vacuolar iron transporter 1 [Coniochaeta hoffmannii]|uniref:Vacuolar iron transporter 1 n=1 Tax=Coniochaeta hoffmannii TaxID=91930 RepID=A0AA38RVK2_9PEZI|nr:Vacuolar iron transporter 1 [Coniochaeta hoffmannii]
MSRLWSPLFGPSEPEGSTPSSSESLPLYSAVAGRDTCETKPLGQAVDDNLEHATTDRTPSSRSHGLLSHGLFRLPSLARFLADFTLGFADGLTVPFALTAGLSSLGRTDTVIYAGMAEICAGSISMGIGGYLAARGEVAAAAAAEEADCDESQEKGSSDAAVGYLAPLDLPPQLHEIVLQHIRGSSTVTDALETHEEVLSPILAGSSVAVGYLLGGLLPLFPYLLVDKVEDGLLWSFVVCAVALFVFGFCKDFALGRPESVHGKLPWTRIRHSAWEGAQMVILGSVAALAAVLCVRAFEGRVET